MNNKKERHVKEIERNLFYIRTKIMDYLDKRIALSISILFIATIFALYADVTWISGLTDGYLTMDILRQGILHFPVSTFFCNLPFFICTIFCTPGRDLLINIRDKMKDTELTTDTISSYKNWIESIPMEYMIKKIKGFGLILKFSDLQETEDFYEEISFWDYLCISDFINKMNTGEYSDVKITITKDYDLCLRERNKNKKVVIPAKISFFSFPTDKKKSSVMFDGNRVVFYMTKKDFKKFKKKFKRLKNGTLTQKERREAIKDSLQNFMENWEWE